MKVFITARMDGEELARLKSAGIEVEQGGFGTTGQKLSEEEMIAKLDGVDAAIVEFENMTEEVIEKSKSLKYIACLRNEPAASTDIKAASARGIPVLFAPGRNSVSVAEYTLGLMLAVARHIPTVHHLLRYTDELTSVTYNDKVGERQTITSEWSMDPRAPFQRFQGEELLEKTLGIVGLGIIGRAIAVRAQAFGMKVIVADPYLSAEKLGELNIKKVDLETLARESDFVAIAAKVTEETKGLYNAKCFSLMKPTSYFINTARAAMVDYDALIEALEKKSIAGAALDVYPIEPLPSDSRLRKLDNVILSPHRAGASRQVVKHHSRMVVEDVLAIKAGSKPKYVVNPEVIK